MRQEEKIEKFKQYLKKIKGIELLGVMHILEVEIKDDMSFEDAIAATVDAFKAKTPRQQKGMLKILKQATDGE